MRKRPDPAREGLGRRLALLRVWGAAVSLLPAIGLLPHGAVGPVLFALALALVSWRVARMVRDGDHGELLFVAGGRVPLGLIRLQQGLEKAGIGLGSVGMVLLVALATPWTLIHAGLCLILCITVWLSLRVQWRATRLLVLLHEHHQEQALALSERWTRGRFGNLLSGLHVTALLMSRRVDEARRLRAASWNGAIDRNATGIALDRVQSGDGKLARQIIEVVDGDDRYARYLRALLGGHLALLEADAGFRVDPTLLDALPKVMSDELRLVDAALARQRGDEALAGERLAHIDLDREAWRSAAYPRLWTALGRSPTASLPAPPAAEAPSGDAFSPPSERAEGPRQRWSVVGALPLPGAPITTPWRALVQTILALLSALLMVVALLLAALGLLARTVDGPYLPGQAELSTTGIGVATFIALRYGILRTAARAERGISLEDGRTLEVERSWLLYLAVGLPFVGALVFVPALLVVLAAAADLLLPIGVFVAFWVLVMALQVVRRVRTLRIVRAVHVGSDDELFRSTRSVPHVAKAWAVLAHYVRGDREAAQAAGDHALLVIDDVRDLLRWDAAASGAIELDALLDLPRPVEPGARFRHEVALRLAALREGRLERLASRIDTDLYLPNRIGDALRVLDHHILERTDPAEAARNASRYAPELREGAWIRRTWSDLF